MSFKFEPTLFYKRNSSKQFNIDDIFYILNKPAKVKILEEVKNSNKITFLLSDKDLTLEIVLKHCWDMVQMGRNSENLKRCTNFVIISRYMQYFIYFE